MRGSETEFFGGGPVWLPFPTYLMDSELFLGSFWMTVHRCLVSECLLSLELQVENLPRFVDEAILRY